MYIISNGIRTKVVVSIESHPDYPFAALQMSVAEDCLQGEDRVKSMTYTYLPHPSQVDTETDDAIIRYREFIAGAEFDDYPAKTLRSLLGKMRIDDTATDIPLDYLEEDADGNGCSIYELMEVAASDSLVDNWCVVAADYNGLGDVDLTDVSKEQSDAANPRAKIKVYSRKNVVNWAFGKRNGVTQLTFLALLERGTEFDEETMSHDDIESYLILALDDDGNYYQQKIIYNSNKKQQKGERSYVMVGGAPLKYIPAEFVSLEKIKDHKLPCGMGYIYPVCLKTLHRYRVSAAYKETQRNLAPTTYTEGWKEGDAVLFKQSNNGRAYVATGPGSVNNLPEGVTVDVKSASAEMSDYQWYFEHNKKEISEMGGAVKSDVGTMTATEADINASDQNAMLESLATSIESAFIRVIEYCMVFEGRSGEVSIDLPRDFATPRLTVDEVRVLRELRIDREISQKEFMRQLEKGGWTSEEIDVIVEELEMEAADAPVARPVDNVNETVQNIPEEETPVEPQET